DAAKLARAAAEKARTAADEQREAAEKARGREEEQRKAAENASGVALEKSQLADRRREQAETNADFSRLAQARLEWRSHNLPAALLLLEQVEKSRRGWAWHYLERLHHGELTTLSVPEAPVLEGLSFSPDGRHVAVAGGNPYFQRRDGNYLGFVVVWDFESG